MTISIACVQTKPIHLNPSLTTDMICRYIENASKKESDLIVFPELILSGYPNFRMVNLEYREKYNHAAIHVNGPELERISKKAEEFGVVVVFGFIERDLDFLEVIYDSSCVIDRDGTIVGTHRKIAPLGAEKLIFKEGDAGDIRIFETAVGKLGIGLCFEHLNPLYRRALTLLGEEIHCALWVTSEDIKHVADSSAKITAIEGGVYVALASQVTDKKAKDPLSMGQVFIGGSGILNPWGKYISGPNYEHEEILYADIDPTKWHTQKYQSRGIEARNDLLSLNIATETYQPFYVKNKEISEINVSREQKSVRRTDE